MAKANTEIDITRLSIFSVNPIPRSPSASKTKDAKSGNLLSNLETNQPEIGSPIIELTGIVISKLPNSASFRSKKVFRLGILEAQVAKKKPEIKKYVLRAKRCFFLFSISSANCKYLSYLPKY